MGEFLTVLGEIFIIICLQSILEVFASAKRQTYMQKMISVLCYLGALYLVIQFAYQYLVRELLSMVRNLF